MSAFTFMIFIISFLNPCCCSSGIEANQSAGNFQEIRKEIFFDQEIWTEYSRLLAIQGRDSFCENSKDAVFPETNSRNLYYRCQNGTKELYQCIEGFEFESSRQRCTPKNISEYETFSTDCSQQMDGFYPDYTSNCRNYFKCEKGVKVEQRTCSSNRIFSFHLQNCQPKNLANCVKLNCHEENDGFFVYPGSKCQAYYYCQRGVRSDFLCPKGSIFSRQLKSCVESGICYEPICTGRVDGNYSDTTHDCTRSFECKGGALETVNNCPSGQAYNGYSCSAFQLGSCEKPEKTAAAFYFRVNDECKALYDGSHIVPGTDCRNVRICFRRKTMANFECPVEQRFNGHQCYPKDMVLCDDVCSMKTDGYYADEFTSCQSYYLCLNGRIVRRKQCPDNSAFNGNTCVLQHLVTCPLTFRSPMGRCVGLRDGFHPDYFNECRNYFYCYNHEIVLMGSCSNGMVWEGKQCVQKNRHTCEGPKELKECTGLSPGLYQNKSSGCTKYFYCNNGSGTILYCPPGQLFNGEKCISSDEYTCLGSTDCVNEPDGYRQDTSTGCRSYYYCSNGNKITYICPNGFIFNGSHCISIHQYKCPFTPEDCIGKNNGYHPDILSGCKKYYYCYNGEKLNTLICSGKKIFDGQGCVLVDDPKLLCLRTNNNQCVSKKDGIYGDPKTNCRRYFRCKNQTIEFENWCPYEYGFDGGMCVRNFTCSFKRAGFDCDGHHVQFFQDLKSNCRNYYICIGKTKTIASCPRGTIFNGQFCIDSNYYRCPRENR